MCTVCQTDVHVCAQLVKKRLPPPGHPLSTPPAPGQQANGALVAAALSPTGDAYISPEDYVAQDEIYKVPHRAGPARASRRRTMPAACVPGTCRMAIVRHLSK